MRGRVLAVLLAMLVGLGLAACGGAGGGTATTAGDGQLVVSAASSLTGAFTRYGDEARHRERVRFSFAGSDELAAQIRQGLRPDVYAAASTSLPRALHEEGLVERPVVFAENRLVIATPAEGGSVHQLADLALPGTTIAIGSASVPIGAYARDVLSRLPRGQEQAILANVRSEEPDAKGIVGKLTQGAVDAGFVYVTDVAATGGALRAIALPPSAQPVVAYGAAVVSGAEHPEAARRFVDGLLAGAGARALRDAGFEPPPSG